MYSWQRSSRVLWRPENRFDFASWTMKQALFSTDGSLYGARENAEQEFAADD